jgi:hypothetical protein
LKIKPLIAASVSGGLSGNQTELTSMEPRETTRFIAVTTRWLADQLLHECNERHGASHGAGEI